MRTYHSAAITIMVNASAPLVRLASTTEDSLDFLIRDTRRLLLKRIEARVTEHGIRSGRGFRCASSTKRTGSRNASSAASWATSTPTAGRSWK